MNNMSLYQLTSDFSQLMEAEAEDEIAMALVDMLAGEIETKAENICKLVKVLESTAASFKDEEKRIAERRKSLENKSARIREYMRDRLLSASIDKLNAGTFKVSVGLVGSCIIDDITQLPPRFITIIPEQYNPDKNAIKAAIKAGDTVPGAHIEASYTMTIK